MSWLRFSASGDRLAVATFDGVVQLWNVGALRKRLAALGLDWRENGLDARAVTARNRLTGTSSAGKFILLPLLGVALALGFALFAYQRQRRLLAGYLQVERLASVVTSQGFRYSAASSASITPLSLSNTSL